MRGCFHPQRPTSTRRAVHFIDRLVDQVRDDLAQLTLMAVHKRQSGGKLRMCRDAVIRQLSSQRLQYFTGNLADVDRYSGLIDSPEQGYDAVEHVARVAAVPYDVIENCAQLVDIERRPSKISPCRTPVCRDGG